MLIGEKTNIGRRAKSVDNLKNNRALVKRILEEKPIT